MIGGPVSIERRNSLMQRWQQGATDRLRNLAADSLSFGDLPFSFHASISSISSISSHVWGVGSWTAGLKEAILLR
jgi:hypothetical protein